MKSLLSFHSTVSSIDHVILSSAFVDSAKYPNIQLALIISPELLLTDPSFHPILRLPLDSPVFHLEFLTKSQQLVLISHDLPPRLKILDLELTLLLDVPLSLSDRPFSVTGMAVSPSQQSLAIAFENGVVVEQGIADLTKLPKCKILMEASTSILALKYLLKGHAHRLLLVTTHQIIYFNDMKDKQVIESPDLFLCAAFYEPSQWIIACLKTAVHVYSNVGLVASFPLDDEPVSCLMHGDYLVIHCRKSARSPSTDHAENIISIYHIKYKYLAFQSKLTDTLGMFQKSSLIMSHLLSQSNILSIFTEEKRVIQLTEISLQEKMETLFQQNMHVLALALAEEERGECGFEYDLVTECHRRYGDWLLGKMDYDGALSQYIATIGTLEASYVIEKWMEVNKRDFLVQYLLTLHQKGLHSTTLTQLLLYSFIQLKMDKELSQFVQSLDQLSLVDIPAVISVLRDHLYYQEALLLAQKSKDSLTYMSILLFDLENTQDALAFLTLDLPYTLVFQLMDSFGLTLMSKNPSALTEFLIQYCHLVQFMDAKDCQLLEKLLLLFVEHDTFGCLFLEKLLLNRWKVPKGQLVIKQEEQKTCQLFLETLLEYYFKIYQLGNGNEDLNEKILDLLREDRIQYNKEFCLIKAKTAKHVPAMIFLYEALGLYREILKQYQEMQDFTKVIESCQTFGNKEPHLWIEALMFFAEQTQLEGHDQRQENIETILKHVYEKNLLPPLKIVQVLSKNSSVTLGMVKGYLQKVFDKEHEKIRENEALIQKYRQETLNIEQKLQAIDSGYLTFDNENCASCQQKLDLPTVNYHCQHSYHQRCVTSMDTLCPKCGPEYEMIHDLLERQEMNAKKPELFMNQLQQKKGDEKLHFIADFFSKMSFVN